MYNICTAKDICPSKCFVLQGLALFHPYSSRNGMGFGKALIVGLK